MLYVLEHGCLASSIRCCIGRKFRMENNLWPLPKYVIGKLFQFFHHETRIAVLGKVIKAMKTD
jgi:hypothetical protein